MNEKELHPVDQKILRELKAIESENQPRTSEATTEAA
jgi:hypothetical protein